MKYASREYHEKNVELEKVASLVKQFFQEEGFTVQDARNGKCELIQAKKGGFFRTILAMNRAFSIFIRGDSVYFTVYMGVSEWLQTLDPDSVDHFLHSPNHVYDEVPETLWAYELEHQLWHFLENQIGLGIQ